MNYFNSLAEQIKTFWNQSTPSSRIGIVGTLLVSFAMLAGVAYWSAQPNYVSLAENLDPNQTASITAELEKANIQFKMNLSGSTILVDQSKLPVARGFIENTLGPSHISDSTPGMGDSPSVQKAKLHQKMEHSLARSIERMGAVENADVHLTFGENSYIKEMRQEAKASVLLKLRPNQDTSPNLANAVAMLVANSVKGLESDNVKVMDSNGRLLSTDESLFGGAGNSGQMSFRSKTEYELQRKAQKILTKLVGPDRFTVSVSTQIDIQTIHSKSKEFDPENKTPKSENRVIKTLTENSQGGSGVAGTGSNLGGSGGGRSRQNVETEKSETSDIEYDNGYTESETTELPEPIKRLSVAAVVDLSRVNSAEEGETPTANPLTKEEIEGLIKKAVGFDEARGDVIEVLISKTPTNPFLDELAIPPATNNEFILEIIRNSSLGLGALFAFVMGFLALRKIRPMTIKEPQQQISPERTKHLSDLSLIIKQNPEVFSEVLTAWLDDSSSSADPTQRQAA